jgi:hypothetical protein
MQTQLVLRIDEALTNRPAQQRDPTIMPRFAVRSKTKRIKDGLRLDPEFLLSGIDEPTHDFTISHYCATVLAE